MFDTNCKKIQNTKCVKRDHKLDVLYENDVTVYAILIGKSETSETKNKQSLYYSEWLNSKDSNSESPDHFYLLPVFNNQLSQMFK